jgi:heat shock protein HtpX
VTDAAATNDRRPLPLAIDRRRAARRLRANWIGAIALAGVLTLIGAVLGYAILWAADIYFANDSAPAGKAPGLFWWSYLGLAGALLTGGISVALSVRAIMTGDARIERLVAGHPVSARDAPALHEAARRVAAAAGVVKPRLVVIESKALNAFAAGRDPAYATVGVTRGLVEALAPDELEGVIAHEMSHVLARDVVYGDVVALLVGVTVFLRDNALGVLRQGARLGGSSRSGKKEGGGAILIAVAVLVVVALLAPLFAQLVAIAVSRNREYAADAGAAVLCGSPDGLCRALAKIDACAEKLEVSAALQHIFIVNPLRRYDETSKALLSTHPPTEARIARLKALAALPAAPQAAPQPSSATMR